MTVRKRGWLRPGQSFLTPHKHRLAGKHDEKETPVVEITKTLRVSRASTYRHLAPSTTPAPQPRQLSTTRRA